LSKNGNKCNFHFWEKDGHVATIRDTGRSNGEIKMIAVTVRKCVFCDATIIIPNDANDDIFVRTHPEPGAIILGKDFSQDHFLHKLCYQDREKLTPS
jgi:hypothetical protein